MSAALAFNAQTPLHPPTRFDVSSLPRQIAAAVWTGADLGSTEHDVASSGFDALDAELPGGGWPCGGLTEILQAQASLCEWRLLAPVLKVRATDGNRLLLVAPPKRPNAPGLSALGIDAEALVWIAADTPAERLWATEQLIKSNPEGAVLAWLPQVRDEQLRRLQVHAQSCQCPVFLFRPETALREASPAPLRVVASLGIDWQLNVSIPKRKGGALERPLSLEAVPSSLKRLLTPRLAQPSRLRRATVSAVNIHVAGQAAGAPLRNPDDVHIEVPAWQAIG